MTIVPQPHKKFKPFNKINNPQQLAWNLLNQVMDPEIPVVSIVELGMLKAIAITNDKILVTITPTFSGCPAQDLISQLITQALQTKFKQVELCVTLEPPWDINDIDESCFSKLTNYGIAPPVAAGESLCCPLCGSDKVEQLSFFGATACKSQHKCLACLEPFEYFKALGVKTNHQTLANNRQRVQFTKPAI